MIVATSRIVALAVPWALGACITGDARTADPTDRDTASDTTTPPDTTTSVEPPDTTTSVEPPDTTTSVEPPDTTAPDTTAPDTANDDGVVSVDADPVDTIVVCGLPDDPANCGTCGHDCGGGECEDGRCRPQLLAVAPKAHGLLVDGAWVWFTTYVSETAATSSVGRVPLTGGTPEYVATGEALPSTLVKDRGLIFWTTWGTGGDKPVIGGVRGVDPDVTPFAPFDVASLGNAPFGLAVVDHELFVGTFLGSAIYRTPAEPSADLAALTPWAAQAARPGAAAPDGMTNLVAADGKLYWTNQSATSGDGGVFVIDTATGEQAPLLEARTRAWGIALTNDYVVFGALTTSGLGAITRVPRDGGEPVTLAHDVDQPRGIDIADGVVYYAEHGGVGRIYRVGLEGDDLPPDRIATGQDGPLHLVARAGFLYWTNIGAGTVMRMRMPLAP